jgi:hypothetical protein
MRCFCRYCNCCCCCCCRRCCCCCRPGPSGCPIPTRTPPRPPHRAGPYFRGSRRPRRTTPRLPPPRGPAPRVIRRRCCRRCRSLGCVCDGGREGARESVAQRRRRVRVRGGCGGGRGRWVCGESPGSVVAGIMLGEEYTLLYTLAGSYRHRLLSLWHTQGDRIHRPVPASRRRIHTFYTAHTFLTPRTFPTPHREQSTPTSPYCPAVPASSRQPQTRACSSSHPEVWTRPHRPHFQRATRRPSRATDGASCGRSS